MLSKTELKKELENFPEEFSIDELIERLLELDDEGIILPKIDLSDEVLKTRVQESEARYEKGDFKTQDDLEQSSKNW
ncbi:hypothetical protein [Leeuwenhoekiella sp. H156]|uniref:hypothetical protein n=1 Tax=Leeuwenhoekiella sp. H156 TaxID=3450128 RepID=UPI003FA43F06